MSTGGNGKLTKPMKGRHLWERYKLLMDHCFFLFLRLKLPEADVKIFTLNDFLDELLMLACNKSTGPNIKSLQLILPLNKVKYRVPRDAVALLKR